MKGLSEWGMGLTIVYLILLALLVGDRFQQLFSMPLNELGDFLAGAFGPLAIFWLILGFLQQGKELQQSTEALKLQATELTNSVQQQKELVEVQREQIEVGKEAKTLELERFVKEAKPIFRVETIYPSSITNDVFTFKVSLINAGGSITSVKLVSDVDGFHPAQIAVWDKNSVKEFSFVHKSTLGKTAANLTIAYTDSLNIKGKKRFRIQVCLNGQDRQATMEEVAE
jgi:hypothetical protein